MSIEEKKDFCTECRKQTEYVLIEEYRNRIVKEKDYKYKTIIAHCKVCGEEMALPRLNDKDLELFDTYYRKVNNIISIEEIKKLMEVYNIGKGPLSLALGFGEITISRYLEGQIPSKKYSDLMREVLYDYLAMQRQLDDNKNKVGEVAYSKATHAINEIKQISKSTMKIQMVIHYILNEVLEITPLALQKLLYFTQGLNLGIINEKMFNDDCEAWLHGPVYSEVYNQYKEYGYNPIEDNKIIIFNYGSSTLSASDKRIIDLVIDTFGMYSGKTLENITHKEAPWLNARDGVETIDYSRNIITKSSIKDYFSEVVRKYKFEEVEDIIRYIEDILKD